MHALMYALICCFQFAYLLLSAQLEALVSALNALPIAHGREGPAAWVSFACRDAAHLNVGSSLAGTVPKQ